MDNIRKGLQIFALLFLISYSAVSTKTLEKQSQQIQWLTQKSLVVDSVNAKLLLKMDTIMKIHPWHKPKDRR